MNTKDSENYYFEINPFNPAFTPGLKLYQTNIDFLTKVGEGQLEDIDISNANGGGGDGSINAPQCSTYARTIRQYAVKLLYWTQIVATLTAKVAECTETNCNTSNGEVFEKCSNCANSLFPCAYYCSVGRTRGETAPPNCNCSSPTIESQIFSWQEWIWNCPRIIETGNFPCGGDSCHICNDLKSQLEKARKTLEDLKRLAKAFAQSFIECMQKTTG